tara:strand:+ start:2166 stop:2948 length:783 start_codon:yes stop_codon:yes gene_type:complete
MILSVSYNFFNGEEHLIPSLESIRNSVEHISVVFQEISNKGEAATQSAKEALHQAIEEGLVDHAIVYQPDLHLPRSANELNKRIAGLQIAREQSATHFFTIDADEFYREEEFSAARKKIEEEGYNSTSVGSFLHIKRPVYRGDDVTNCAFITKIEKDTRLGTPTYPSLMVDPTRKISVPETKHYHFKKEEIAMYHMNMVRKDIREKLNNSSTTDKGFLNQVHEAFTNWEDKSVFNFPRKGPIVIEHVQNEFNTYDPGEEI